jgi:hypothetical protein
MYPISSVVTNERDLSFFIHRHWLESSVAKADVQTMVCQGQHIFSRTREAIPIGVAFQIRI